MRAAVKDGHLTVLNSLNGGSRPICLVFRTAALGDALAPCINYLTYLLTYLLKRKVGGGELGFHIFVPFGICDCGL